MLVLDLFYSKKLKLPIKEWIDVAEKLPSILSGIFKVRLLDKSEIFAYFYKDKRIEAAKNDSIIGVETIIGKVAVISNWYDKETGKPIDITHWGVFDEN